MQSFESECVHVGNVVCTWDLGVELNLKLVAPAISGRYDPAIFPACVSYCKEMRASIQSFATGKQVAVGCRSEEIGKATAHLLVHTLCRVCGIDQAEVTNFYVRNIVCSVRLGFEVNLSLLYEDLTTGKLPYVVLIDEKTGESPIVYQPNDFPGLAFAIEPPPPGEGTAVQSPAVPSPRRVITFALFEGGNGVATGLKCNEQVGVASAYMREHMPKYELGKEYRVQDPAKVRKRREPPAATATHTSSVKKQKTRA